MDDDDDDDDDTPLKRRVSTFQQQLRGHQATRDENLPKQEKAEGIIDVETQS